MGFRASEKAVDGEPWKTAFRSLFLLLLHCSVGSRPEATPMVTGSALRAWFSSQLSPGTPQAAGKVLFVSLKLRRALSL